MGLGGGTGLGRRRAMGWLCSGRAAAGTLDCSRLRPYIHGLTLVSCICPPSPWIPGFAGQGHCTQFRVPRAWCDATSTADARFVLRKKALAELLELLHGRLEGRSPGLLLRPVLCCFYFQPPVCDLGLPATWPEALNPQPAEQELCTAPPRPVVHPTAS